ncbi:MAG: hypothetical protein HY903_06535 [Deltaproteobacteria bacterium]|nr:hypothetical protein [Deltaproteobacteria bacterium]
MWPISILFIVLVIFIGVRTARARARKIKASVGELAAALGFEVLQGREAVRRMIPEASAPRAMQDYEKLPGPLRRLLEAAVGTFCIAGRVDGVAVVIFTVSRGGGKSQTTYTVVRADYPTPLPIDVRIAHEGTLTRLGKALFGLSDVEIGDPEFDRAVRIKAKEADAGRAKVLLGSTNTRAAILRMLAVSESAFATQTYAQWERQGRRFDVAEMRTVIGALVPVARALCKS